MAVEAEEHYVDESTYWNDSEGLIVLIFPLPPKGATGRAYVLNWVRVKGGSRAAILVSLGAHCVLPPLAVAPPWSKGRRAPTRWIGGGLRRKLLRPIRPGADSLPASGLGVVKPPPWAATMNLLRPKYPALTSLQLVAQRACKLGKAASMAPLALTSPCLVGGCACNPG